MHALAGIVLPSQGNVLEIRHQMEQAPPLRLLLRTLTARDEWLAALQEAVACSSFARPYLVPYPVAAPTQPPQRDDNTTMLRIAAAEEAAVDRVRQQAVSVLAAFQTERRAALDTIMGDFAEEAAARETAEADAVKARQEAAEAQRRLTVAESDLKSLQASLLLRTPQKTREQLNPDMNPPGGTCGGLEGQAVPLASVNDPQKPGGDETSMPAQRAVWPAATRREL